MDAVQSRILSWAVVLASSPNNAASPSLENAPSDPASTLRP